MRTGLFIFNIYQSSYSTAAHFIEVLLKTANPLIWCTRWNVSEILQMYLIYHSLTTLTCLGVVLQFSSRTEFTPTVWAVDYMQQICSTLYYWLHVNSCIHPIIIHWPLTSLLLLRWPLNNSSSTAVIINNGPDQWPLAAYLFSDLLSIIQSAWVQRLSTVYCLQFHLQFHLSNVRPLNNKSFSDFSDNHDFFI